MRASDGREYTTFRPPIGQQAEQLAGRRARIEFHEDERGPYRNTYLDAIAPAPESPEREPGDSDPDEVAWSTAVDAAPWLLGTAEPEEKVSPDELYERLEPFKRRVADDIRGDERED